MTEREILERARTYIDKMANGVDPLTDQPVPDGDLINNVRVSRCLFYVSKVLGEVLEKGIGSQAKQKKKPFTLPEQLRSTYPLFDQPMPVSKVVERINELCAEEEMTQLKTASVTQWLVAVGLLEVIPVRDGKTKKQPTQSGRSQGISQELRNGLNGPYEVVLYDRAAQQFILDNIDAIAALQNSKTEMDGQPWAPEHDALLRELYAKGTPIRDMAAALKRKPGAVRARIHKLAMEPENKE